MSRSGTPGVGVGIRLSERSVLQDKNMTSFEEATLTQAAEMYAVANTPLFLVRKLREDSAASEISASFDGATILEELKKALLSAPRTPDEYVRPYVYLVALAQKSDNQFLQQALSLAGHERWDWFDYIASVLLETHVATGNQEVIAAPTTESYDSFTRVDSPVSDNYESLGAAS
jgi:hypothetical protein